MRRRWLLAANLVLSVLAGCLAGPTGDLGASLAPATEAARMWFEDPRGDAVDDRPTNYARFATEECAAFLPVAAPACGTVQSAIPDQADGVPVVPVPASLDLLSVEIEEQSTRIVLHVTVASLDQEMREAAEDDTVRNRVTSWGVCWNERSECALMKTARNGGVLSLFAVYHGPPECGNVLIGACGVAIPWEIDFGDPATIRLEVPRDILPTGGQGQALADPLGVVIRGERVGEYVARGLWGPNGALSYGATMRRHFYVADETAPGPDLTFALEPVPFPQDEVSPIRVGLRGDVTRTDLWGDRPDVDILEQRFIEEPGRATVAVKLAEVSAQPVDHVMLVWFRTRGYPEVVAGYGSVDGVLSGWAVKYPDPASEAFVALNETWERTVGSPGWLNVTLHRHEIDDPQEGYLVDKLLVQTRAYVGEVNEPVGPAHAWLAFGVADDTNRLFPAYRWRSDSVPGAAG